MLFSKRAERGSPRWFVKHFCIFSPLFVVLITYLDADLNISIHTSTMKYVLVTGGVISGIGKGVISSSIGALLKGCGLHVTSIKIDPYLNIDAGTFSPYEHGISIHCFSWIVKWAAIMPARSKVFCARDYPAILFKCCNCLFAENDLEIAKSFPSFLPVEE